MNIERYKILSSEQCSQITDKLFDVEAFWLSRHRKFPFYTLGATHYYDIHGENLEHYLKQAERYNKFLISNFDQLYNLLTSGLEDLLQDPVLMPGHNALPGFHIFSSHKEFINESSMTVMQYDWLARRFKDEFPGSPVHRDIAHEVIDMAYTDTDISAASETFSFTLPVCLPVQGSGLKIWSLDFNDDTTMNEDDLLDKIRQIQPDYYAYEIGEIFLHNGQKYHQATGFPTAKGDHRITLQGHCLLCNDGWHMHW